VIYSRNTENANSNQQALYMYKVSVLSREQIALPQKAIAEFFKKYTTTYINRELEDWLEAAICYTGKWPDELFCRGQLLDTHRYIFVNKRQTHIKLLQWEGDGYSLYYKRLEMGTFEMPACITDSTHSVISAKQLMLILQGISLKKAHYRKRYVAVGSL
jgi:transposase